MQGKPLLVLLLLSAVSPVPGHADPGCDAPVFSDQQIEEIIATERASRTDLPVPFPQYRSVVRRRGCHYTYIEYGLPERPEYNHIIKLNQHGVIVDASAGGQSSPLQCPGAVLTDNELAEVVRSEREKRRDLPPAFSNYETRVVRMRCLYLYFEYAVPRINGEYQVFTIDPFGELMEFRRSRSR